MNASKGKRCNLSVRIAPTLRAQWQLLAARRKKNQTDLTLEVISRVIAEAQARGELPEN